MNAAQILFQSGQYDDCLAATEDGIDESYRREDWWALRIQTLTTLGRYEEAVAAIALGLARSSDSIRIRWVGREAARLNGDLDLADRLADEIGLRTKAQPWKYGIGKDQVIVGRYQLDTGVDPKTVLDGAFAKAQRSLSSRLESLIAAGQLALGKDDFALAAEFFSEAIEFDEDHPDAQLGLAMAYESSDAERAEAALERALTVNPKHIPSLLFVAGRQIDREQYAAATLTLEKVAAVNPTEPLALAYKAVLAHLRNDIAGETKAYEQALAGWSNNPAVPHLIGQKLSRKYRFDIGAGYQRRALEFDPSFLPAQIQLSQDLLRLGQEEGGWALARKVADQDPYNVLAYNLATLNSELANYVVLERRPFRVRMDRREASLYGTRVLELLAEAAAKLSETYETALPETVSIDIYPKQQDFAIRTFGLPGGEGFLGVCFGPVITMNSPAALRGASSNWESVLWHEFAHVITLTKTTNCMPRWLSEGISVFEERLADSRWGQQMSPTFRTMIVQGELTPVSELSGAFLTPPSPAHLDFAYFESSLVVEFLVREFGREALNRVLDDLGNGVLINDALSRNTINITDLDAAFAEFATTRANEYGSKLDFDPLPQDANVDPADVDGLLGTYGNNAEFLQKRYEAQIAAREFSDALETVEHFIRLYADSRIPTALLVVRADLEERLGHKDDLLQTLEQIVRSDAAQPEALVQLMVSAREGGNIEKAASYANQLLAIDPLLRQPHETLAEYHDQKGDTAGAVASLKALAELDPDDPAGLQFEIAKRLNKLGMRTESKRAVLLAIEEAPRYRDAHALLLQLVEDETRDESNEQDAVVPR